MQLFVYDDSEFVEYIDIQPKEFLKHIDMRKLLNLHGLKRYFCY
jgi:hypothetical protein